MSRDFKTHTPKSTEKPTPAPNSEVVAKQTAEVLEQSHIEEDRTKFGDWSVNGRCVDF